MAEHIEFGKSGENYAKSVMEKQGFTTLECNWRWKKYEIDLIARKSDMLVFVEVKSRKTFDFDNEPPFVALAQQKRIIEAASTYILQKDLDVEARFDVISVQFNPKTKERNIAHFEEAFCSIW